MLALPRHARSLTLALSIVTLICVSGVALGKYAQTETTAMAVRKWIFCLVAGSLFSGGLSPVAFGAETASPLTRLDRSFVCPEAMGSDQERTAALRAFADAYVAAEPHSTPADMVRYRRLLLEKHGCRKTLERLDAAAAAERNGDVRRQAWLPLTDTGKAKLFLSMDNLSAIIDPRFPDEQSVEAYSRLTFLGERTTNATRVSYDKLVSRAIYF